MNKRPNLEGTNPVYKTITVILLIVVVLFFLFPLYWIISGSFKILQFPPPEAYL